MTTHRSAAPTPAETAAWWPVPITSVSGRIDRNTSGSSCCGCGDPHERPVRVWAVNVLPLCTPVLASPARAVGAGDLQPAPAELTPATGDEEGGEDAVTRGDRPHRIAHRLDDAHRLMAHTGATVPLGDPPVEPQVRPTDGGVGDPDHRRRRRRHRRCGDLIDDDLARCLEECSAHRT
ncbi:UNVERIFIED_CONTAM: hypothetical protein BEN50_25125 [Euhalothece sp. KZN 001]